MIINKRNIKREITNELRNADLISTGTRGVTTTTEEFNGTGAQTDFILTGTGTGTGGIKNVRTVIVDSVAQEYGTDWDVSDDFSTVIFVVAPASGTDNVDITYDYSSSGDRIYPDNSQNKITNDSFPRIIFAMITLNTKSIALGGDNFQSSVFVNYHTYGNSSMDTEDLSDLVRDFILQKRRDWFYLNFLIPENENPLLPVEGTNNKKFQRDIDAIGEFEFECP